MEILVVFMALVLASLFLGGLAYAAAKQGQSAVVVAVVICGAILFAVIAVNFLALWTSAAY